MRLAGQVRPTHDSAPTPVPNVDPPPRSLWRRNTSLHVLAFCAVIVMMQFTAPLLLPIVLSLMLFYMLDPVVDWLQRWHVPRLLGSIAVVLALIGAMTIGAAALWPQVDSVLIKVPEATAQLRKIFREHRRNGGDSTLDRIQEAARAVDTAAAEASKPTTSSPGVMRVQLEQPWRASDLIWTGGLGAVGIAGQAVTVLFLTIFLLYEDDSFKRKLVRQMETSNSKRITVRILNDIATQIERFIWVQALTSVAVAVATWLALWWLGIEEPLVWGVLAGVMNIVPYFGPLIVTAGLAIIAFLQFGTIQQATLVAGVALAITTIEGVLLTPHLLSRAASLNHVAIFVAIAFWSWAWGVPGMLLAVPMLMAMKAVCDHVEGLQGIGEFIGHER
ncbi:MAG TPA: AI-2E family transporter [Vicinamibacterales bacterium]